MLAPAFWKVYISSACHGLARRVARIPVAQMHASRQFAIDQSAHVADFSWQLLNHNDVRSGRVLAGVHAVIPDEMSFSREMGCVAHLAERKV